MKNLQRIKCFVFLILALFLFAFKVDASLEISEIMYDPEGTDTNREWVKLYNNGDEDINIIGGQTKSAWRISGGEPKESLHYINEDLNISAGCYAVIAKNKESFKNEHPSFSGLVTTASISFNNTGGFVKIWDGLDPRNVVAELSYSKDEIALDEGDDIGEDTDESSTSPSSSSTFSYTSSSSSTKKVEPKITKINAEIISDDVVVSGLALKIKPKVTSNKGMTYNVGRFVWNFGDGTSLENKNSEEFEHIYWYPGEYLTSLEFYKSNGSFESEMSIRKLIKVIPSSLYISSVGDYLDPYVEFENKSKYELNLSEWEVKGVSKSFIIPKGTILLPNKKIKLSSRITNFNIGDVKYITIINSNREVMATYPNKTNTNSNSYSNSYYNNNIPSNTSSNNSLSKSNKNNINTSGGKLDDGDQSEVVNLNNLEASAIKSGNNFNINYYILGLVFIIGLGISSVFLLKKNINDDKEELEDRLTADNIKILE